MKSTPPHRRSLRFFSPSATCAAGLTALLLCAGAAPAGSAALAPASTPAASAAAAPPDATAATAAPGGTAAQGAANQGSADRFAEKVLVREIEVVVEIPDSLREGRRKSLVAQDFQVQEDGEARQIVKASPIAAGDAGSWDLVIYVDRVLSSPDTVFFSANALAQHAAQLIGLGSVEIVVADPRPHVVLAQCHEARVLEQALTDIAAQAERDRSGRDQATAGRPGGAKAPGAGPLPDVASVTRQEDRLVSRLVSRAPVGPHALVLVADGFDTSRSGGTATSASQAIAEEPARTLAAYGWIILAAPMRKQAVDAPHREMTDTERIRESNSGKDAPGSTLPPEILPQAAPNTKLKYDAVLDLFTEPTSATLATLASATAGEVVGFPNQLTAALTNLSRRWHLFYLAPDPEDGRPRPVEVRLAPGGTLLRVPVWRRSSTTEAVSTARVRQLLGGSQEHGTLSIQATATPTPGGESVVSLRLTVPPFAVPEDSPAGPFRLTVAFAGPAGPADAAPTVRHRLLLGAKLTDKGWTQTLPVDYPQGTRRIGVEVEDLAHQLWGVTTIDLGPPSVAPTPQ